MIPLFDFGYHLSKNAGLACKDYHKVSSVVAIFLRVERSKDYLLYFLI